jgi:hypothetical protein
MRALAGSGVQRSGRSTVGQGALRSKASGRWRPGFRVAATGRE